MSWRHKARKVLKTAELEINIARDFSDTPGARYKKDGDFSGQEFREKFLEPLFADPDDNTKIRIILDGTEGYATSFLEEAFGGLTRQHGVKRVQSRIKFVSTEDKLLVTEVSRRVRRPSSSALPGFRRRST